jgi:hypothetical protein
MRRLGRLFVVAALSVLITGTWAVTVPLVSASGAGQSDRKGKAAPLQLVSKSAILHRELPCTPGTMVKLTCGPWGNVRVVARRTNVMSIDGRVVISAPSDAELETLASAISVLADPTPTTIEILTMGPHDKKWMKNFKKFPDHLKAMPWRVDYTMTVPEYTSLTIEVGDGQSVVEGVQGIISVVSVRGDIRVREISGATRLTAYAGKVEILTSQRTWRGGNISASASGDVTIVAPRGFSADGRLTAKEGIFLRGDQDESPGNTFNGFIGNGGPGMELTAGGRITIVMGQATSPAPSAP